MKPETGLDAEPTPLEELGRELGTAIAESPEYRAFEEARTAVENDPDCQEQIAEFEQLRQEFLAARQLGTATEADIDEVSRVQARLHDLPVMRTYLEAQEALTDRLAAVNEAISDPLAVDFGGEAGGCCHD